ncbi:MAG TPA: hypothetical protein VM008_16875 [Phycisphaerae bacterium]|nr:hypothetical protein [Phycisphaerae bacterium]
MIFAIPTYRLRDVSATIEAYDENFWRNGHTVPMVIFDDSTTANCEKYYPLLESTPTVNELFYVGPREKEEFVGFLCKRLHDRKIAPLVKNLFRPSYGGNRNVALMYTLGSLLVSADDDMRPFALVEDSVESLADGEIGRGKLVHSTQNGYTKKSYDILASFKDVLGKRVSQVPANYEKGELVVDSAMDLETNMSKGVLARENSLLLKAGKVSSSAVVKMAQTFRSGTNDIDAVDYARMFLEDEGQADIDALTDFYVLVNFRPVVTKKSWRMDCGVAGYDNTLGLPPFFPTRLRFEDYIYRLWIQQPGLAAAHVDSAQTHMKNNYMRSPLASEVFNEAICGLLKKKIFASLGAITPWNVSFDYEGEVTLQDTQEILDEVCALRDLVLKAEVKAAAAGQQERERALRAFAINLERTFYGFESDFFQQNVARMVDDVISLIKGSLDLWPTLVEICYFHKSRKPFPMTRVKNKRKKA